jgi:hypothetical protein
MAMSGFERRLRRIETRMAPACPATDAAWNPFTKLMLLLLAHHLGGMGSEESIMDGYSRALGFRRSGEVRQAGLANSAEITDRHQAAVRCLFASRGYDLDEPDDESLLVAMRALIAEVPRERLVDNGIFIDAVDFLV